MTYIKIEYLGPRRDKAQFEVRFCINPSISGPWRHAAQDRQGFRVLWTGWLHSNLPQAATRENNFYAQAFMQLMGLYTLHKGQRLSVWSILRYKTTPAHLRVLTELLRQIKTFYFNCVTDAVEQSLRSREGSVAQLFDNLSKLVAHEMQQKEGHALQRHLLGPDTTRSFGTTPKPLW